MAWTKNNLLTYLIMHDKMPTISPQCHHLQIFHARFPCSFRPAAKIAGFNMDLVTYFQCKYIKNHIFMSVFLLEGIFLHFFTFCLKLCCLPSILCVHIYKWKLVYNLDNQLYFLTVSQNNLQGLLHLWVNKIHAHISVVFKNAVFSSVPLPFSLESGIKFG